MVAEPIGVVAGVTPVTNPTSTTMFKTLISMKGRNPIIFSFHPSAQKCSAEAARILRDAAIEAGAPENCVTMDRSTFSRSICSVNETSRSIINTCNWRTWNG